MLCMTPAAKRKTAQARARGGFGAVVLPKTLADSRTPTYMCSIMTWPKPEQLTWVAPSIRRAKS